MARRGRAAAPLTLQTRIRAPMQRILPGLLVTMALIWITSLYALNDHNLLYSLALIPRSVQGLNGILTMPLVHGSFEHLLVNSSLLAVFASILLWRGTRYYLAVVLMIQLLAGGALWLVGRSGAHIGASVVIFGCFGLLATRGIFERRPITILVSLAVAGLYSSLLWGVIPDDEGASWEGHGLGLMAGILTAWLFAPRVQARRN